LTLETQAFQWAHGRAAILDLINPCASVIAAGNAMEASMRHEVFVILLLWIALQIPLASLVSDWIKAGAAEFS
jgi:hypothetical protein